MHLLLLLAVLALAGCGHQRVSAASIGCHPDDIEIRDKQGSGRTRTWIAICHGVEFRCSGSVQFESAQCAPVRSAPTPPEPRAAPPPAHVERALSSEGLAGVRAKAPFDARQSLTLYAAPGAKREIDAAVSVLKQRGIACGKVSLVANLVWRRELPFSVADGGAIWQLRGGVEPGLIDELARPEPTLELEACGQTLRLDANQLAVLARFATVYRDLAGSAR